MSEEATDSLGNIFMIRSVAFSFRVRLEDGKLFQPRGDKRGQLLKGIVSHWADCRSDIETSRVWISVASMILGGGIYTQ